MSLIVGNVLTGTEGTGEEEVECITGIEYFGDQQNFGTGQTSGAGLTASQPQQFDHPVNHSQYQTMYSSEGSSTARPSGTGPSIFSISRMQREGSGSDILGLASEDSRGLNSTDTSDVRQSPGILSYGTNDSMETHGCQLCKRKFCNPVNLLRHMKEFHHVDTAHVVGRRRANAMRQGKAGAEKWQVSKLVVGPSTSFVSIAPKNSAPLTAVNPSITSVSPNSSVTSIVPNPAVSSLSSAGFTSTNRLPIRVVPYGQTNERQQQDNVSFRGYHCVAPKDNVSIGSASNNSGGLTAAQIKAAEELIVADIESFYCSKCLVRFASRILGEKHARVAHFGEVSYFCVSCNTEYTSERDHSQICPAALHNNVISSNSGVPLAYTLSPISAVSGSPANLRPFPVVPVDLPPSSSEISSTSSDVIAPEKDSILPSSSRSPDCEVTSQAGGNGRSHTMTQSRGNCSSQMNTPSKHIEAINIDPYVSLNGSLTDEQIKFAARLAQKVTDEMGRAKWQCKICRGTFANVSHCRNHVRHFHLKEQYKCCHCEKRFPTRKTLEKHMHVHRDVNTSSQGNKNNGPVGMHATEINSEYLRRFLARTRENKWECTKCKKILAYEKYALSHVRQVHFNKSHQCNSCGLYFESGLLIHRKKCNSNSFSEQSQLQKASPSTSLPPSKSAPGRLADTVIEVTHLTEIMRNSVQETEMLNVNKQPVKVYKCLLCSSSFDKRMNAESHLWIEHIRKEWAEKCGTTNVDDIYLQFLQAQFTSPASHSATSKSKSIPPSTIHLQAQSQYAGEVINPLADGYNMEEAYFNENDEEMLFDPTSVSGSSIFVEESTATGKQITKVTPDDENDIINAALQCKVEMDEGDESLDYGSSANTREFNEDSGYPEDSSGMTASATGNHVNSISAASKVADSTTSSTISATSMSPNNSATVPSASNPSKPLLSQSELEQLNKKALQLIMEKQGQFVCIVCQRISKLRRTLVEHVRRVHLCGEVEVVQAENEAVSGSNVSGKDYYNEIVSRAVTKFLSDKPERPQSGSTVQDRASRFIRPDGTEYFCTICKIRSTRSERLTDHIISFHFGEKSSALQEGANEASEEILRCPGCKKVMPTKAFKARHMPRCSLAKRLCRRRPGRPAGSSSTPQTDSRNPESTVKCNFYIDENGKLKRKPGRPYRNPDVAPIIPEAEPVPTSSRYTGSVVDANFYIDSDGKVKRKAGRPFRNPPPVTGPHGESYVIDPTGKPVPATDKPAENPAVEPADIVPTTMTSKPSDPKPKISSKSHFNHSSTVANSMSEAVRSAKVNVKSTTTVSQSDKNLTKLNKYELPKPSVKNDSNSSAVFKLEDVKKLIIPWSIGGKYSFSKCKECSVLFTKYTNAEAHVRNIHLAVQTVPEENESPDQSINKNRSTSPSSPPPSPQNENSDDEENSPQAASPVGNKSKNSKKRRRGDESSNKNRSTSPSSPTPSPQNEKSDEEENSPQATSPVGYKSKKSKTRRRVYIESDSEEDEGGVYESFSPMAYSNDEEDAACQERDTTSNPPLTSDQLKQPEPPKSTAPTTPSHVLNKRPFSAFQAGDVLKKYMQPKRVSKALTSLTSKEFTDAQKFIVKIDKSGYECRGCGGKFPRLNAISRHVRLKHFVERPYHCTICDERFFHLNEFEMHKSDCTEHKDPAVVSPKKPKLLAQSWSDTSAKVKSGKRPNQVHSPPDIDDGTVGELEDAKNFVESLSKKRYRCKICKLTFGGGYGGCLKHVRKIHFGEKPFKCLKCNETFRYVKTYRNHGEVCGTENAGITGVQKQISSDKSLVKTNLNSKSTPVLEPPENITYKCKLCNEVSSDKPLFRYHLVSVHYEELSKGKPNSFYDMIEDIIDTLTVKTKPKKSSLAGSQSKKSAKPSKSMVKAAGSPDQTKPVPRSSGKPKQAQSIIDSKTDSSVGKGNKKETMNKGESWEPLTVHKDENQLLASLPELTHGGSIIKTTVRLEPLSFKGVLPDCLLSAAKALCGKLDAGTFQCKSCGRCFSTYGGVMGHVRIHHYGERRYQCDICNTFLSDGLSKHRARCFRRSQGES